MSAGGNEKARAVALEVLAACSPGMEAAAVPVTATFRCWTPLGDWEQGEAGVAALRKVMRAYCARLSGDGQLSPSAVITDGTEVVVEASIAGESGQLPVCVTLLLVLKSGLVDEVRCYVDPRAVGAS